MFPDTVRRARARARGGRPSTLYGGGARRVHAGRSAPRPLRRTFGKCGEKILKSRGFPPPARCAPRASKRAIRKLRALAHADRPARGTMRPAVKRRLVTLAAA